MGVAAQEGLQPRAGVAYQPGQQAGEQQHGEDPPGYGPDAAPEADSGLGVHQRYDGRDEEGRKGVDEHHVAHVLRQAASQPVGDHSRRGCGRAYEAEHRRLHHNSGVSRLHQPGGQGESGETEGLEEQQPKVPAAEAYPRRGHLHELQEEHYGNENLLSLGHDHAAHRPYRVQGVAEVEAQVQPDSRRHGDGQHPVLDELQTPVHLCRSK